MGFYPNWAWSWPANRRVLYNRASADPQGRPWDPKRAGDPVGRRGRPVGRRRARLPGRPPIPTQPERAAAVHHDRRGHRAGCSATASPTDRSPSTTSRSSRRSRTRCTRPCRPPRWRSSTTRRPAGRNRFGTSAEYPYVATSLPAHRARALRHPAHRASGAAAAGGLRRGAGRAGPREGHRERRPGAGVVQARQARGPGGRDQAARAAARSTARRSTRSASRSTGASSASTRASTGWPTR